MAGAGRRRTASRRAGRRASRSPRRHALRAAAGTPVTPTADPVTRAQVTKGSGTLPNEHGQVWREYDITPYTLRNASAAHPEQAIVDWILRETGYEAWHATPVGLLSADRKVLRVYHTPQMQAVVAEIVDRFVSSQAQNYGFGLRIITMKNPNWRIRGAAADDVDPRRVAGRAGLDHGPRGRRAAARRAPPPHRLPRADHAQPDGPQRPVDRHQHDAAASPTPRASSPRRPCGPATSPSMGQLDEGFSLEFSPLLVDRRAARPTRWSSCELCQVEKMLEVQLEAPSTVAQNQQADDPGAAAHDGAAPRAVPLADGPGAAVVDGRGRHAGAGEAEPADRRAAAAQDRRRGATRC